ncbi:DoxX family protein [Pontimicrobium sp. MEBiC06410]
MNKRQEQIAFLLLRITIGVNFLGHGLARFSKLEVFKEWMVTSFKNSIIPTPLVAIWGSILPFLEFGVGLLLIIGLFTYRASVTGALVIIMLLLGSTLIEKWDWAGMQMIYALFFYILINHINKNYYSIDTIIYSNNENENNK